MIQRVGEATVQVEQDSAWRECGRIGPGLLILLGVGKTDKEDSARWLADRCSRLRIFEDEAGKMNRSLLDTRGSALVVSQFTLYADTSRGLRPSFEPAALPETARSLYEVFVRELQSAGIETSTGSFGGRMKLRLENDGPVTILLDSDTRQAKVA